MESTSASPAVDLLGFNTVPEPQLQAGLEVADRKTRNGYGMTTEHTAVGVLDLMRPRLAMLRPDRITYGASVPKIGILLAYFEIHPEAATHLDPQTRHELGLMIKISSNEMAAKYSRALGLKQIQEVLYKYGFYDASHGGGIWVGKHYGESGERIGDPVADHSHAVTVRQCLRFYSLLEERKLVSEEASRTMRQIFESPEIRHERNKFVKGLAGRNLEIIRKSGSWENWLHDTAVISGPGRHYALVGLTEHPKGDDYLAAMAGSVDDLMG
ncbi:MAG TPA: serine hydrolase [Verrucomicrobiae bacterium]